MKQGHISEEPARAAIAGLSSENAAELRHRLNEAFGPRLRGVWVYGSRARGDAQPDSDLDLLVLLTGPIQLWNDIRTAVHAVFSLQLDWAMIIQPIPVSFEAFEKCEIPLYQNARREGCLV